MEPPIFERSLASVLERDKPWFAERQAMLDDRLRGRLRDLSNRLGEADWLEGTFTAGDLMMIAVMRRLKSSGILEEYPNLSAYIARGEARPAFKRAFDAQLADFNATEKMQ